MCRCAPSPFDSFRFDCLSTCLVSDPFFECKPFLEESPTECDVRSETSRQLETMCADLLGLVTCHFLSEHTIKDVSKKTFKLGFGRKDTPIAGRPHALDIFLSGFHVNIYGPEVPSFGMRVDHALEQGLAALGFTQFVFELSELGDGLEVWASKLVR